jgi:hypothetical protein
VGESKVSIVECLRQHGRHFWRAAFGLHLQYTTNISRFLCTCQ